jgi:hypothetical protein
MAKFKSIEELRSLVESSKKTHSLTIDELATLLERNKHKFIFYSYFGGMGGEFILNYLSDNVPNIIKQKDAKLMEDFYMMGWDGGTNKHYFADTVFCHYFLYAGMKSESSGITGATNFTELAEKILTGLKTDCYGYPEHDFNTLTELDKHEDMRYLVKVHNLYDELTLFKDSKMIRTNPGEWKKHCGMLCLAKNETLHVYSKEDKKRRIEILSHLAKGNDPFLEEINYKDVKSSAPHNSIEIVNNYLSKIIEDDNVPLYNNTIAMALQPDNYALDMSTIPAETINNKEMLHKLYFSDFIDEDTDDTFEAPLDIPSANELKVSEYDFNDIGNGKWIEDEFGLDVKKFRDVFDDWYDKNIELLNEFELKNHHIPKKSSYIPRSKRYNGLVVMDRTARLYHQLQKKKT